MRTESHMPPSSLFTLVELPLNCHCQLPVYIIIIIVNTPLHIITTYRALSFPCNWRHNIALLKDKRTKKKRKKTRQYVLSHTPLLYIYIYVWINKVRTYCIWLLENDVIICKYILYETNKWVLFCQYVLFYYIDLWREFSNDQKKTLLIRVFIKISIFINYKFVITGYVK